MTQEKISHAAGNPGEDPDVEDVERYLTKGGSAEARARDPHENPEERWEPEQAEQRRHGGMDYSEFMDDDEKENPEL
jgi:hypothetical protein